MGRFIAMIGYKSAESAKYAIAIEPRETSQICSNCGSAVPQKLSYRTYNCHICHITLDRDLNASKNVLTLGLSVVPATGTESPAQRHEE